MSRRRLIGRGPVLPPRACRLCWVSLLVIVAGCSRSPVAEPAEPASEFDVDTLVFEPAELKQSFQTYTDVASRFCRDGFRHQPFRVGGNNIYGGWIKGGNFRSQIVFEKGVPPTENVHEIIVQTHSVPPPRGKGQVVDPTRPQPTAREALIGVTFVSRNPDEWCTSWGYNRKASRLGGTYADWHVRFCRWNPARLHQVLQVRPLHDVCEDVAIPLHYYSGIDNCWGTSFERPAPPRDDFFRRMKSADAMRETQLADLDQFEADVTRQLDEGRVTKFVATGQSNNGMPPPGNQVPLSEVELAAERAQVKAYFAAQRTAMREHSEAMYAAFRRSFPIEECWPELAPTDGR